MRPIISLRTSTDVRNVTTNKRPEAFFSRGFTIVELLIVIVVIGILAAIVIIAFNGVQKRATEASIESDLRNAATQMGLTKTETGSYPSGTDTPSNVRSSRDNTISYRSTTPDRYCLEASNPGYTDVTHHITQDGTITAGACPRIADGSTWTAVNAPLAFWSPITYGNGRFVALSANGSSQSMSSTDGVNWTARPAGSAQNGWSGVTYANGLFVGLTSISTNGNQLITSTDGQNWTERAVPYPNQWWGAPVYGNGRFVSVSNIGSHRIMSSTDGINWTAQVAPSQVEWGLLHFVNGHFIALSANASNAYMRSTDGLNWTTHTFPESRSWFTMAYGNGRYVLLPMDQSGRVLTSTDGLNWTAQNSTGMSTTSWMRIVYGNGVFVAAGHSSSTRVATSTDGINWTARSTIGVNWYGAIFADNKFVLIGNGSANPSVQISP